jgi:predicted nuclease with RNAse H fold
MSNGVVVKCKSQVSAFFTKTKKLKRWTRSDGAGVVEIHPETELNTIWKSSPEEEKKKQE